MSEKTKEVPRLADTTYAHTLAIKSAHEYGDFGSRPQKTKKGAMAPIVPGKLEQYGPWTLYSWVFLIKAILLY